MTKSSCAATAEHGLSPRLIKARADYSHSPWIAWSLVVLGTASFYLGPLILLAPFFLCRFHPRVAVALFFVNLFLAFYPVAPWPRFRKACQMFYSVFNFHHNITPRLNEIARKENRLVIFAQHPHAIIPLHGFVWGAVCDQLLPDMYGYGCTTVRTTCRGDLFVNVPCLLSSPPNEGRRACPARPAPHALLDLSWIGPEAEDPGRNATSR